MFTGWIKIQGLKITKDERARRKMLPLPKQLQKIRPPHGSDNQVKMAVLWRYKRATQDITNPEYDLLQGSTFELGQNEMRSNIDNSCLR